MIRNLKILIAAAMALTALGIVGASGAQAAGEGKFHCSVEPCSFTVKADGTGKTAHHVFIVNNGVKSAAVTCNEIKGNGTSATSTSKQITLENIEYTGCSLAGSPGATVSMNTCDYLFTDSGKVHVKCPEGKKIHITLEGCTIEIGSQEVGTVAYAAINSKKETTVTTSVKGVVAHVTDEGCVPFGLPKGTYESSEYSTGNTIVHSTGNSVWYE